MQPEDHLKESLSHLRGCIKMLEESEVSILGKTVNNHKDGGSAIGGREPIN
jgi:hypothetical protein